MHSLESVVAHRDGNGASAKFPPAVLNPQIRLLGRIDEILFDSFLKQMAEVPETEDPVAIELMTFGGDPEIARRFALEIRLATARLQRRLVFIGKTVVYSAGVGVMAAFPRADRFLTRDALLMIHGRELELTVQLSGSLTVGAQRLRQVLAQIETGLRLEQEGFRSLAEGSKLTLDELTERAATNWYLLAAEALRYRLIAGLV
jgi:ATP-dependent protease ClpP protease subunit